MKRLPVKRQNRGQPRHRRKREGVERGNSRGEGAPGAAASWREDMIPRRCAKTPLAREFVSHSRGRVTNIAAALRDSSATQADRTAGHIAPPLNDNASHP
jgi:hypothetical protein